MTTKMILRYVKGTKDFGLLYGESDALQLISCTDSDCGGSVDDWKWTIGYIFSLGTGADSWASKKQHVISLSYIEAEYRAVTNQANQATNSFCDNQGALKLAKNLVFREWTKHIDVHCHSSDNM